MAIIESGGFRYEWDEEWGRGLINEDDSQWGMRKVSDVGTDSNDNVYLLTRSNRPVIIADKEGNYIRHLDERGLFGRPHGITISKDNEIYIVDYEWHTVRKFDENGTLLLTLGDQKHPSETGCTTIVDNSPLPNQPITDYRTVKHSAGPFNCPTALAIAPNGDLYITDGYGNARVHCFSAAGKYIFSWGEPGIGPGQFYLPHGITITDNGIVYVCDRENNRIQLFDLEGNYIREIGKLIRPSVIRKGTDGLMYLCECKRCDKFDEMPSRLTIMSEEGEVIARFDNGIGRHPEKPYHAAHGMAVDSEGNIYMGEVGAPPKDYLGIKKYVRI